MLLLKHPKYNEWASFVEHHPHGSPFQHPDCHALFSSYGKLPHKALLHFDQEDHIDGIITAYPCSFFPQWPAIPHALIGINAPLVDPHCTPLQAQTILYQLHSALRKSKNRQTPLIEVREMNGKSGSPYRTGSTKTRLYLNLVKEITSPETILQGSSPTLKREIQRIRRSPFTTEEAVKEDLVPLLHLFKRLYRKIRKPMIAKSILRGIVDSKREQYSFRLIVTKREGRICGGALLGFCKETCYEWYIVSDRTIKDSGVATTWGAMEYAQQRGYKQFDFMGIGREGIPYGVRRFKLKFGGTITTYHRYWL
ncbi:MAG: hypothetical protein CSA04_04625 [Bacteroidetes bacterium]|nr:MAG: hypothetical protein CSA04_04625 [Bacteroidota bacterium]